MHAIPAAVLIALACTPLSAQAPASAASAPAPQTYSSPLGFGYILPADWDVVLAQPSSPQVHQKTTPNLAGAVEKRGIACTQVDFTARHGDPRSVIVQVALPFDCYGQRFTHDDLPGLAAGAAQGIKENFEVGTPQSVSYDLGAHSVWAERAHGTLKGQPDKHYTIEIACALLSKAAVCWQALAADPEALATFEQGLVTLEGDAPLPLVPAGSFKP